MTGKLRKSGSAVLVLVIAACGFATLRSKAADEKPAPDAPADAQFYELRIYTAAPGKMDALHKRFRDVSLRMFEKHGIKNVAYWTAVDEKHQGKLYYVLAYPDRASREKMLVNGIAKDPEFLKAVAASEKDGKLVESIEEVFLTPTDYSPMK